ncbi:MAG: hypothetical protein HRU78_07990 [Gammaproteobacteria bacterium]|nr:MAG: hypothetical protein HRU78_07990 [Gammaproteobacteria bacterium]
MGYRFQNQCYETKQEFLDALAQNCYVSASGSGGLGSFFTTCTSNSDNITVQSYTLTNGTAQTPWTLTPQLIACTYQAPKVFSNADVVELSWLVVGVWVAAWGIRKLSEMMDKR